MSGLWRLSNDEEDVFTKIFKFQDNVWQKDIHEPMRKYLEKGKYLEENEKLIMAILQNRSIGKEAECAVLEARLQRNLTYLAAVADCQGEMQATPQPPPRAATQLTPQFRMPHQPHRQTQQEQMIPQSIRIPPSTLPHAQQQPMGSYSRQMLRSGAISPSNMSLGDGGQPQRSGSSRDLAEPATLEAEKEEK